jgi:hypothetical protein
MFVLCAQCISGDNLGISFGKCHFCYTRTYLFVHGALISSVLCSVCAEGYFYLHVLKKFSNSSHFFTAVCERNPFCFLVMKVSVLVLFLWGRWFSD